MPAQWATTQNHLGLALLALGEREGNAIRRVNLATGIIERVAGTGVAGFEASFVIPSCGKSAK